MKKRVFLWVIVAALFCQACSKDFFGNEGSVKITFYPIATQFKDETLYWYLFSADAYTSTTKALRTGYLSGANASGALTVSIDDLNAGNYIFKFFQRDSVVLSNIQVRAKKNTDYVIK